jgi:hypothetical protein
VAGTSGTINRQLRLAQRPTGMVDDATFDLVEEPIPELADGEYLVRHVYLSIDPTQGWSAFVKARLHCHRLIIGYRSSLPVLSRSGSERYSP